MNKLVFGKNDTQGIVAIEDNGDGTTDLSIQQPNGVIAQSTIVNDYWILTDSPTDEFCRKLDGNGYYKYLNPFSLRSDFYQAKKHFQKYGDKAWWVNDPKESFMLSEGYTYYKGLKQQDVSVLAFDIETTTLEHNKDAKVLIISNTFRDSAGNIERKLFCYDEYKTTKEFLEAWCSWVRKVDPSIVTGHNVLIFDIPYLAYIATTCNFELTLGRKGKAIRFNKYTSKFRKDASQFIDYNKCYIYGREIVDTFFLSIKYDIGKKYESYRLKSIIEQEGLEVENRQFYDASLIRKNYLIPNEWAKIKAYALHDADDALALWDLQGPSVFYWAQKVPKSLQEIVCGATGSQLNAMMVRSYLQDGHSLPKASEAKKYVGASVNGFPGIYKWAIKFDIASLYPSIILQYNIFDREKDPKGHFFEIVKTLREYRLENKKKAKETGERYYSDIEQSEKTGINSCYGFLGASRLLFNSPVNAARITEYGREILSKAIDWATKVKEFVLINYDTDAITITHDKDYSKEEQTQLLEELNSNFPQYIKFEPDGYFHKVIVLAAKNYILYDGKSIKTKGSSLKDSKKEPACREMLDKMIHSLVHNDNHQELVDIYHSYIKEALAVTDIKRWSSKKTITEKVESSERANETKLKDAIKGSEYTQADKVYVFFRNDESLCLAENFDGVDYNKKRLIVKLFKITSVFKSVLPVKTLFLNYGIKRNKMALENL